MVSRRGALDVLAQHILGCACSEPFDPDALYAEVRSAAPYRALTREDFGKVVDFVSTGGYALKTYDRFARLRPNAKAEGDMRLRAASPAVIQQYRMNVGTIVEAPMLKVRMVKRGGRRPLGGMGGRYLGEIEEYFIDQLAPGDTFLFAGHVLRFEGLAETEDAHIHVRDRIMAVLFTRPAERVMRPRFGAGLDAQVFQNISPLALSAIEYRIRESLDAVFAGEVTLEELTVEDGGDEGTVLVSIDYALRADRTPHRLEVVL